MLKQYSRREFQTFLKYSLSKVCTRNLMEKYFVGLFWVAIHFLKNAFYAIFQQFIFCSYSLLPPNWLDLSFDFTEVVGLRDSILGMLRSPWASRLPRESWGISSCIEGEGSRTKCFRLSRALPVPASPLSWPESQLHRAPCRWTLIPRCFRNIKTSSSLSCKQLTAPLWLLDVLGLPTAQFPGLGLWQSRATLRVSASATKCLSAPPTLTGRPGTASHVTVHCFWKPLKPADTYRMLVHSPKIRRLKP